MRRLSYFLIFSFLFFLSPAKSQLNFGGEPLSFSNQELQSGFQKVEIVADRSQILVNEKAGHDIAPYKIGFTIPTDFTTKNSGSWYTIENGDKVWKLEIKSPGAEALTVYFKNFELPEGAKLFLYNKSRSQFIGAFTSENTVPNGVFATELIQGDVVTLEYFVPADLVDISSFTVSEIGYIYRDSGFDSFKNFGQSGGCEVNVNCSEGQNWQDQKRGVVRIVVKSGSGISWCTGSLINNTGNDFTPYLLTANHCGQDADAEDYAAWVFYFNYESQNCEDPQTEPESYTMSGATLKARADNGTSNASDFKLMLLNEEIPTEYNPYFNGWTRSMLASNSGVGIHHPSGDIKKYHIIRLLWFLQIMMLQMKIRMVCIGVLLGQKQRMDMELPKAGHPVHQFLMKKGLL